LDRKAGVVTTILDLIGALLLIVAAAWFIGTYAGPIVAVASAGALVLVMSWAIDKRGGGR
jgi:hypothetical protein